MNLTRRKWSATIIIFIILADTLTHTHVIDFEKREGLAAFGIQVLPVGELLPFTDSWIHTFVIRNPTADDYQDFLLSLRGNCEFSEIEDDTNITVTGSDTPMLVSELFSRRCDAFTASIITATRTMIYETFGSELPQPHDPKFTDIDASILAHSPIRIKGSRQRDLLDLTGHLPAGRENMTRKMTTSAYFRG